MLCLVLVCVVRVRFLHGRRAVSKACGPGPVQMCRLCLDLATAHCHHWHVPGMAVRFKQMGCELCRVVHVRSDVYYYY
jgi:hypothetical protein